MKKVNNLFLTSASLLIISIYVYNFIPKINNFEDELIALTSHIFFLTELEYKAPYLVDNFLFTPALTTGFNSSVGGALGWMAFKNFYFSRLFNFIWLVLEISLLNYYLYKNKIINIKFIYYSFLGLFCIPLWFNSLYGLGEVLSSVIFVYSLLLYEKKTPLSMFLMSISIFFGKFIIFLSFLIFVLINIKKENIRNILYFLIPPSVWLFIIFLKTGITGLYSFLNKFITFLFGHGISETDSSLSFIEGIVNNIVLSEIPDWSYATIIRVVIVPLAFSLFLLYRYLIKKSSKIDLSISAVIIVNYIYFYIFSYQKYLRYSQIFLVITIYFLLYFLSNEETLTIFEKIIFISLLSFYLSNEILIILLIIYSLLNYGKKTIFISIFTFLILNIANLQYESNTFVKNNLNIYECKNNISSIPCIKNYLPYEYKIVNQ